MNDPYRMSVKLNEVRMAESHADGDFSFILKAPQVVGKYGDMFFYFNTWLDMKFKS